MLSIHEVSVELGGRPVLDRVSLEVESGVFCALMGPNGSGKTTLLRAVLGSVRTQSGSIALDGHDTRTLTRRELAKTVALLRQEPRLDFDFTVLEVVLMGRSPHKGLVEADDHEDLRIAHDALSMTDSAHIASRLFTTLSGGEKQRVLLARAIAQKPRLLLLDEPTNHLDIRHQLEILACVKGLGITVLAALHDLNLAFHYADTVVLLTDGRVHTAGPMESTLVEDRIDQIFGVCARRTSDGFIVKPREREHA